MNSWLEGIGTASWQQAAQTAALADKFRAEAFGITSANVGQVIQERSQLLQSVLPGFSEFCQTRLHTPVEKMLPVLWDLWLPLAMKIALQHQQLQRPVIQGILGGQGTGKTTMCQVLGLILQELGYRSVSLSIDDLYKTYSDRLALVQVDPRLIWRGPPGTHDVDLGLNVLEQIRASQSPVIIPRFDKSAYGGAGDRTHPEIVEKVDILLFEGWLVGVRPIHPDVFDDAPPPILTDEDRVFARDMNQRLCEYLPLWERLDSLVVLYPLDYRWSVEWRKQAEQQMIAAGKTGMSDAQIEEFVNYFWRSLHPELFIKPLVESQKNVDLVIEIHSDRSFGKVYHPVR
ncbi:MULTISPECIES: glycerate kinase [unclassified Anabaena]|uniref:glycerate kinase n=1 Tax=unclassified Anabaena TaxID=2619674 RepID=UPI000829F12B|nr:MULTISPECIES: glycerate kinase [unclassified Anabaena]